MELLHRTVKPNISNKSDNSEDIPWETPLSLLTNISDDNESWTDFIVNDGSNNTPTEDLFHGHESNLPNFYDINGNEYTRGNSSVESFDFEDPFALSLNLPIIRDSDNSVFDTYWNIPLEPSGISENDDLRLANFESEIENMPTGNSPINKITCPLKQELNLKIQLERLKRGESELCVTPEPSKTYELREDEVKKRNIRLQQNRKSANKSRLKEQCRLQEIQKKFDSAMANHRELQQELEQLKTERTRLRHELDKHSRTCVTTKSAHVPHLEMITREPRV